MYDFNEVKRSAKGKWASILADSGIDPVTLQNRHGFCPGCGGIDRFRFDDKNGDGTFFCNGGGEPISGDGFILIQHVTGCTPKDSLDQVARTLRRHPETMAKSDFSENKLQPKSSTLYYAQHLYSSINREDAYVGTHPYSIKKGVYWAAGAGRTLATGKLLGKSADCIVAPQRTLDGHFVGVECINTDGIKQSFGKKGVLILGNDLDSSLPQLIVEGWATGARLLHILQGNACIYVCFGKGLSEATKASLKEKYPTRNILIGRESDG